MSEWYKAIAAWNGVIALEFMNGIRPEWDENGTYFYARRAASYALWIVGE